MKKTVFYCYDAYCGWCYGFSPVMKKIAAHYINDIEIEVLSGGMMTGDQVVPIKKIATYIKSAYKRVEELTGIKFGEDFLWHINNPEESDWVMNSEKPAIALCIFKEYYPARQLEFASDLQYGLNHEGRDLDDNEAYRHLLEKYSIQPEPFYEKLLSEEYRDLAYYEFALCKQLQVTGFPAVLMQLNESKFYLLARGYTAYDDMQERMENVLKETAQ
ncbi:MAG: DsbA family protein [Ferruginibacter sp.]